MDSEDINTIGQSEESEFNIKTGFPNKAGGMYSQTTNTLYGEFKSEQV